MENKNKGEARIGIVLKNGQVGVKTQVGMITQSEISMLIVHLELLRDHFKFIYQKGVKQLE